MEYEAAGQLRWEFGAGSELMMAPFSAVLKAYEEASCQKKDLKEEDVFAFFANMPAEGLEQLAQAKQLWSCTRTAGDIVYTPPGWVIAERLLGSADSWGFRKAAVAKADLPEMEEFHKVFPKVRIAALLKHVAG